MEVKHTYITADKAGSMTECLAPKGWQSFVSRSFIIWKLDEANHVIPHELVTILPDVKIPNGVCYG